MLLVAACDERAVVATPRTAAEAVRFIGHDLPADAADVRVAGEAGLDTLLLVRFSASAPTAAAFARVVVGDTVAGRDCGLGYLGKGLDWWPATPPTGFSGGEARGPGSRTIKLIVAPGPGDQRTVYVAAFSS